MQRTLLVIGAGGSKAVHEKFPVGIDLVQLIDVHLTPTLYSPLMPGQGPFISTLVNSIMKVWGLDIPDTCELVDYIKRKLWGYIQHWYHHSFHSNPSIISIDQLVEKHFGAGGDSEVAKVIKFAIAYIIKGSEDGLFRAHQHNFITEHNWITKHLGSRAREIDNKELSLLTFNYDRVIQYEFLRSTGAELPHFAIHHVYGNIGSLTEFDFNTTNEDSNRLRQYCEKIKLVHERAEVQDEWRFANFERILFVGFAFDAQNMKILQPVADNTEKIGMIFSGNIQEIERAKAFNIQPRCNRSISEFLTEFLD